jgi:hypothetical protein
MVGAIHGRLLTAWSVAGVLGPVLVNYIREYQIDHGVARADAYSVTMYILAGLLVLGFICNWLVKPVASKHYMSPAELAAGQRAPETENQHAERNATTSVRGPQWWPLATAWTAVWIPLGWGIWVTLEKAVQLFR